MQRGASGRYESSVAGGEAVRAFVPAQLPPRPPLALDGRLQGPSRAGRSGARSPRQSNDTTSRPRALPLHVRPQRGSAFVADRGHSVVAVGSVAIRARRNAGGTTRRCGRGFELRGGARARAEPPERRLPAVESAAARNPWCAVGEGPRQRSRPWALPPQSELGRRPSAGSGPFRAAPAASPPGVHGRARALSPRRPSRAPGTRASRALPTSSSRQSTHSSTATAVSVAY